MAHPFPLVVQVTVACRSRGRCERCKTRVAEALHHRRAKGMGGSTDAVTDLASNAAHLCHGCHLEVHANPAESYATGWLVRRNGGDLPEEVPVKDYAGDSWFFTDEGESIAIYGRAS